MRIIAGTLKGRRFDGPPGETTRPTSDKVREALFNILFDRVEGARVLDCFAGSGGLSFEALSRGAAHATLIERDRAAVVRLKDTVARMGLEDQVTLLAGDMPAMARRLPREGYDMAFLDPPYGQGLLEAGLQAIGQNALLAPGGILVCEHTRRDAPPAHVDAFVRVDTRRYGNTHLSFYVHAAKEEVLHT